MKPLTTILITATVLLSACANPNKGLNKSPCACDLTPIIQTEAEPNHRGQPC